MGYPIVSIVCLAYNHIDYICDAIEGMLEQNTNFDYEILIHDDASTDGTTEVIREYEEKYPNLIYAFYEEQNQYQTNGFIGFLEKLWNNSRGEYIAYCEGDDYWIDRNKLQIQVEYMQGHEECVLVAHDAVRINYFNCSVEVVHPEDCERDMKPEELLLQRKGGLLTASLMFRKSVGYMTSFFKEVGIGDYPLKLYYLTKGKIHYLDRIMSVYRWGHKGSWSQEQHKELGSHVIHIVKMVRFLCQYNKYVNGIWESCIKYAIEAYVFGFIEKCEGYEWDAFQKLCDTQNEKTNRELHYFFQMLKTTFQKMFVVETVEPEIEEFCKKYQHIVIFGSGVYGCRLASKLENNNILYSGFVISDLKDEKNICMGKPVWCVDEFPFSKENTGIIVAVNFRLKDEVDIIIQKTGFVNCMYPFDITEELLSSISVTE